MNRRHRTTWVLMAVAAIALVVAGAIKQRGPSTQTERGRAIAETVKCPVCGGETVADSNASVAVAIREFIATQLSAGKTDDEVRAAVERQYAGTQLVPPASGSGSLVWVLPVVALGAGVVGLVLAFRRWRVPDESEAMVEVET